MLHTHTYLKANPSHVSKYDSFHKVLICSKHTRTSDVSIFIYSVNSVLGPLLRNFGSWDRSKELSYKSRLFI
uniref:Uncharacterized protein n=1 Tax=Lepeophtheirus salmonis TaxID=72036 RepID=A0A0K2VBS4_LEPSM